MRKLSNPSLAGVVSQIGACGAFMDIDKFNSEIDLLYTEIRTAMNSHLPFAHLCDGWDLQLEKLIKKAIKSNDDELILKRIVFLIRAGIMQDENFQRVTSALNDTFIPGFNKTILFNQMMEQINAALSGEVQKNKSDKQRGGKKSAENRKSSQYLDLVVKEYNELVSKNHPFHKRGRLREFYDDMEKKYPDIDGGAPSIKQRIEKVRKLQKNIQQAQ